MTSTTTAGPTSRWGGTWSTVHPSLPVTQCAGASTWVPVCSPVWMLCHFHIGPSSSKELTVSRLSGIVFANGGGSCSTGVVGDSGAVRSRISTRPEPRADSNVVRTAGHWYNLHFSI